MEDQRPKTRTEFAKELGYSRTTLWAKIQKYNLNIPCRENLSPISQKLIREALGFE